MSSINNYLTRFKNTLRDWVVHFANAPHAKGWLAFFSFAESSFFPVPPDILLIAILSARAGKWILHALITTCFSVLGGLFGYAIGFFFFDFFGRDILALYGLTDAMAEAGRLFNENAFWAIFISAFSPIPYKVFTISAGFFDVSIATFIIASIIGRGLRFFSVAFLAEKFGWILGRFIFTYFNAVSIFIVFLIILFIFIMR